MTAAGAAGAAGAAAAVAAAQRRRAEAEEEHMTGYRAEELEGWEFKIIRTSTRSFADREKMRAILSEEGQAGWELVEKFDDYRVRLKRRTDARSSDSQLSFDPYRTHVGTHPNVLAIRALVIVAGVLTAGLAAAIVIANQ